MTEDEWQSATDPSQMLASLPDSTSDRKLRLFACGCCRRIWHLIVDPRCREAVEVAEWYADGQRDDVQLLALNESSYSVYAGTSESGSGVPNTAVGMSKSKLEAANAATHTAMPYTGGPREAIRGGQLVAHEAQLAFSYSANSDQASGVLGEYIERVARQNERTEQADLVRDIFGNPFRPVTLNLTWLTSNVVLLAEAIYQDRAFERMPILADALMDAGCEDDSILAHCRSEGPHVRGCWVVDFGERVISNHFGFVASNKRNSGMNG
jgi:hypothetical protein